MLTICTKVCQKCQGHVTYVRHAPFWENYLCNRTPFQIRSYVFEVSKSNSFEDMLDRLSEFYRSHDLGHAPLLLFMPLTEFEVSSTSSFEDMLNRMTKILGVTLLRPRPFWENYLRTHGIEYLKLRTKFEVSS